MATPATAPIAAIPTTVLNAARPITRSPSSPVPRRTHHNGHVHRADLVLISCSFSGGRKARRCTRRQSPFRSRWMPRPRQPRRRDRECAVAPAEYLGGKVLQHVKVWRRLGNEWNVPNGGDERSVPNMADFFSRITASLCRLAREYSTGSQSVGRGNSPASSRSLLPTATTTRLSPTIYKGRAHRTDRRRPPSAPSANALRLDVP
jgi:hypothetical protein